MADGENFLKRIRGNAEWEVVKFIGGSGVMTSVWNVCVANIHHVRPDWLMWDCVFGGGVIMAVFGYWRESKSKAENIVAPKVDALTSGVTVPFVDLHAVARNQDLVDLGIQVESLFSVLELEAIQLAKNLQDFLESHGPEPQPTEPTDSVQGLANYIGGPRSLWRSQIFGGYAERFAPKIKSLTNQMQMAGLPDQVLPHFSERLGDIPDIYRIQSRLWIFVLRSKQIDLQGEGI